MATRSSITLRVTDEAEREGNYKSIYCHYDGYIEDNGKTLFNNYTSARKVYNLLRKGDIRVLGPDIDTTEYFGESEPEIVDNVSDIGLQEFNYLFEKGQWFVQATHINNGNWTLLKNALEAIEGGDIISVDPSNNSDYVEYVCVNNIGMEDNFNMNEAYVSNNSHEDSDMIYVYDNHGEVQECFAERFRVVMKSPNLDEMIDEVKKCKCDKCGLFGVDKDSEEDCCPYALEINGEKDVCNCCEECRYQCAQDI